MWHEIEELQKKVKMLELLLQFSRGSQSPDRTSSYNRSWRASTAEDISGETDQVTETAAA
jgi:hypothetical protein